MTSDQPAAEAFLMFHETPKEMVPVCSDAFRVTQSSKRALRRRHGALLVARDGTSRRIAAIDVLGWWGQSFGRKFLSALTGAREINVHFDSHQSVALSDFKDLVSEYLVLDQRNGDPYLTLEQPLETVLSRVRSARDVAEIFRIIEVPEPADCLDVF